MPTLGLAGAAIAALLLIFGIQEARLKIAESGEKHAKADLARMISAEKAADALQAAKATQASAISEKASSGLQTAQDRVVVKYRTLVQKVGEIPEGAWRECVVPDKWVDIWDGVQP